MDIIQKLNGGLLIFDGAMGTQLQRAGLAPGELPELWNVTHPDVVEGIHLEYLRAGCDIIKTNTFGANSLKLSADELKSAVSAALDCARKAIEKAGGKRRYIALDIGPSGRLLKPYGDLEFERAVELFSEVVRLGAPHADVILIETMNDSYETKAAVLAAKENCSLPIFVSNVYDENAKLMTGADVSAMTAMLEGLGVDAIGMNCSLGPAQMLSVLPKFIEYSSLPVIVSPNAGLPRATASETTYDVSADQFAGYMKQAAEQGARILGGCCGTTPDYVAALCNAVKGISPIDITKKDRCLVSSYTHAVELCGKPVIIGERINPTGKKRVKQALRDNDFGFIMSEGVYQQKAGADILDVNCGLPELNEAAVMKTIIEGLQGVTDAPLQIDTADSDALAAALRVYNGKPMINSVNGKRESMEAVFPLAKKYGGVIVALTLDESGIPETAEGRVEIAEKIINTAESYGIDKKDIVVDTLTMSISTDKNAARVTLDAVKGVTALGVRTVLGVSNISFGLPQRDYVNSKFLSLALCCGLSAAIMNPFSELMRAACAGCGGSKRKPPENYSDFAEKIIDEAMALEGVVSHSPAPHEDMSLNEAICAGLCEQSEALTREALKKTAPLELIGSEIIPALNKVGDGFESGGVYLPQLLMSAEAAKAAFSVVKNALAQTGAAATNGNRIIVATVKGDIHDIGKNIVKILLENYGFEVIDLGKDVSEQTVAENARNHGVRLVALSALMTTTVGAMEKTIELLRTACPGVRVMVGGAVMNAEYAKMINADFYSKDAMGAVRIAQEFFSSGAEQVSNGS